jgi:hypothetical protein
MSGRDIVVIGASVLSGMLHDGVEGLKAIKLGGGGAVTQHPHDACHASMPRATIRHLDVDYCLPVSKIGPLLVRLTSDEAGAGWPDGSTCQDSPREAGDSGGSSLPDAVKAVP